MFGQGKGPRPPAPSGPTSLDLATPTTPPPGGPRSAGRSSAQPPPTDQELRPGVTYRFRRATRPAPDHDSARPLAATSDEAGTRTLTHLAEHPPGTRCP